MERNPWKSTKLSPFDPPRALLTPLPAAAFNTALELARAHCTFTEEFLFHTLPFSFFFIPAHSLWQCHFLLIADFSARADNECVVLHLREFAYEAMKVGCVCVCIRADRCTEPLFLSQGCFDHKHACARATSRLYARGYSLRTFWARLASLRGKFSHIDDQIALGRRRTQTLSVVFCAVRPSAGLLCPLCISETSFVTFWPQAQKPGADACRFILSPL